MLSRLALTCFLIAAKVVEETREPLLAELADLAVRKGLIASITAKQIRVRSRRRGGVLHRRV